MLAPAVLEALAALGVPGALEVADVPEVPAVLDAPGVADALAAPVLSAGTSVAAVRMNFGSVGVAVLVPAVPLVVGAADPVVPAVPVGASAAAVSLGDVGAAFRQPVTVTLLLELEGVLC